MVVLRSVCVGIAFVVGAIVLIVFVGLPLAFYFFSSRLPQAPEGGQREVGWDLVTMYHNSPMEVVVLPLVTLLAIFLAGFLLGFRHFSHSLANK